MEMTRYREKDSKKKTEVRRRNEMKKEWTGQGEKGKKRKTKGKRQKALDASKPVLCDPINEI